MKDLASPVLAAVMVFVLATPVLAFMITPARLSLFDSAPAPDPDATNHNATAPLPKVAPTPAVQPAQHHSHHHGD